MNKPRVYFVSAGIVRSDGNGPNYELLATFGTIKNLIEADEGPKYTYDLPDRIMKRLESFDPDHDYIVWGGGDPLSLMLVGACLVESGVESFRWLRLDRAMNPATGRRFPWTGNYVPVTIELLAKEQMENENE